jgi:predicted alpha/beta-hydrolase family hydrolase
MADLELRVDGASAADATVLLAHGAGAPMDSPFMERVATGLAEAGLRAVRFEFPYMYARREGRRRGPDRASVLAETWREAVRAVGVPGDLVIGGKSLGGRIAAHVADELGVRGLVCLGYPFHPPGRPEKLRTAVLQALKTPTLIVQGTRDPFGRPAEVDGYDLSPSVRVFWSEDGDHSLKPRVRSGRTLEANLAEAIGEVVRFARALA